MDLLRSYTGIFIDPLHKLIEMDMHRRGKVMGYIFWFLIGFGLSVSGGVTLIAYMNFLPAGITWVEYFIFVKSRIECYFFPLGMILMAVALYKMPNNS